MSEAMNQFLADNERKAFRMVQLATSNSDDALDIVQEAMINLVRKYIEKPETEWAALFYRILQRQITNWYRRQQIQKGLFQWFSSTNNDENELPMNTIKDPDGRTPDQLVNNEQSMERLQFVLSTLPLRQRQVFLLRSLQGFDTKQTAVVMGCSEGSVKTHYHRALRVLRDKLEEFS